MIKKRIAILTEHKSINYGSVLQLYALYNLLSERHDVTVLNYRALRYHLKEYKDFFFKLSLKKIRNARTLYSKIRPYVSKLNHVPKEMLFSSKKISNYHFDKIVVGSDEMWNFNNPYRGKDLTFFGENWNCDNKVSFATSFGSTKNFLELEDTIRDLINKFSLISVRDFHSKALLKDIGIDASLVLDPTYMFNFEEKNIEGLENYVFVYGYFDKETTKHIIEYCKKNYLKTLSPQASNNWCDKIIPLSPTEWIDHLYSCKYVFTSSFHGTIFSVKFKKNFMYFYDYWSFNKVINILDYLGLKNNHFTDHKSFETLNSINNYDDNFVLKINQLIKDTQEFIKKI